MSSAYLPIVTGFQPFNAYAYSLNISKQAIKYIKILGKKEEFAALSQFYAFSDGDSEAAVIQFINDHPWCLGVLFEAPGHIFSIFGKNVFLYLELNRDYEEDFEGLFIIIKTNLSPEDSLNLLDRFDEGWWLDVDYDIGNILEIMVRPT
ncbi:MAG: hypothetical protein CHKLHMKO_00594 [Candidatus Argoarchaeum ethanivorans]|uniref:Uncharacterized protein n=1 Tax=Candidatus Argoarchaeum ethanivorans TaxID=2608793 RepID=A0A811T987_9EURY|nr:MAG: hypothetical protein CHKLHMKO_00594 [Candidatus Argoarchaeum ethanivorans]